MYQSISNGYKEFIINRRDPGISETVNRRSRISETAQQKIPGFQRRHNRRSRDFRDGTAGDPGISETAQQEIPGFQRRHNRRFRDFRDGTAGDPGIFRNGTAGDPWIFRNGTTGDPGIFRDGTTYQSKRSHLYKNRNSFYTCIP